MSMSVGGGDKQEVMCEMNTTPLIDVMLVLLVTLILTLPIQTHAVKLDMPPPPAVPPPPPPVPPTIIDLEVDFDNSIVWDGQVVSLALVEQRFRIAAEESATPADQPEIHLRPNRRSKYDVVAKVLAVAQRNGMTKIGFVNTAEFANE
jgi:biopolymer transport protein ExbD